MIYLKFLQKINIINPKFEQSAAALEKRMNSLSGMEKFSHLEDKIYLTIEFAKKMREEKEKFEREMKSLRHEVGNLLSEKSRLEEKVEERTIRFRGQTAEDARISRQHPE